MISWGVTGRWIYSTGTSAGMSGSEERVHVLHLGLALRKQVLVWLVSMVSLCPQVRSTRQIKVSVCFPELVPTTTLCYDISMQRKWHPGLFLHPWNPKISM